MGTPFYMSPEQLESARDVDGRADIWALGVIMHELLTGNVPFMGETLPEVCIKIATHPAPPIRQVRRDVPEAIEAAILRCLARDRAKRFATAAELAAVLAPFGSLPSLNSSRDRMQGLRMPTMAAGQATAAGALADLSAQGARPPWGESLGAVGNTQIGAGRRGRTMGIAVAAGAVVVAALGIGLFVATRPAAVGPAESPALGSTVQAAGPSPAAHPAPAETHPATALAPPPAAVLFDAPDAAPGAVLAGPPAEVGSPSHAAPPVTLHPERPHPEPARPAPRPPSPSRPAAPSQHPGAESAGGSAFDERL